MNEEERKAKLDKLISHHEWISSNNDFDIEEQDRFLNYLFLKE